MIRDDGERNADYPEGELCPAVGQGSRKPRRLDFLLEIYLGLTGGAFYTPRHQGLVQRLQAGRAVFGVECFFFSVRSEKHTWYDACKDMLQAPGVDIDTLYPIL